MSSGPEYPVAAAVDAMRDYVVIRSPLLGEVRLIRAENVTHVGRLLAEKFLAHALGRSDP